MLKCYQEQYQKSNAYLGCIRGVEMFGELLSVKTVVNLLSIWGGPDSKGKNMKKKLAYYLMREPSNYILILVGCLNNSHTSFHAYGFSGAGSDLSCLRITRNNY